jgi:hypothetical protein
MRNFDAELLEDDLSFQIGGEVFKMRYVRPEVLASWGDELVDGISSEELLKRQDERIASFLDGTDDSRDRWMKLRAREDNAVPMVQVNELLNWMIEVQTSRPTTPPPPSVAGRGKSGRSSGAE